MRVRQREPVDRSAIESFLARWNSLRVARLGVVEQPLEHPALIAEEDGRLVGVLSYVVDGACCEVLTLHADVRGRGVGTALIGEVKRVATGAGCTAAAGDHDERQRRCAAFLSAARLPARGIAPGRRR
jgi:GNAT superfamily N-acetyltransferase